MNNSDVAEGKTIAIISYLTVIGTVVAFVMNQNKRNSFASFHIRQAIGVFLVSLIANFLRGMSNFDILSWILVAFMFVLWIIGFVGAIQGEEKRVPFLGDQFQEWFRNIA